MPGARRDRPHRARAIDAAPLAALPAPLPPAIRALPPTEQWINVRTLGVKGDGQTDDTAAHPDGHRRASACCIFPSGFYIVRDTIALKPDTVLIALHPGMTQIDLPDRRRGFQGVGAPKALLRGARAAAPTSSAASASTPAASIRAPRRMLWMAGEQSLLDDVQFHGGGGTLSAAETAIGVLSGQRPAAAARLSRGPLGAQYPSIWVTQRRRRHVRQHLDRRTRYAQAGFYVSDTTTPGHVYELSAEHHLFNEIKLDRVENWDFNAPQTEEEVGDEPGGRVARDQRDSKNITIANYHGYRVTRSHAPFPAAVRVYNSSRHPLPQRPRQRRERLRHLRRERLRHLPARQQVPRTRTRSRT